MQNVRYVEHEDQFPNPRLLLLHFYVFFKRFFFFSSQRGPITCIQCHRGASDIMFSTYFVSTASCVRFYHMAQLPIGSLQILNIQSKSKSKSKYPVAKLFENAQPYQLVLSNLTSTFFIYLTLQTESKFYHKWAISQIIIKSLA